MSKAEHLADQVVRDGDAVLWCPLCTGDCRLRRDATCGLCGSRGRIVVVDVPTQIGAQK